MIPADPVTTYLNAHFRPDTAADLLAAAQPLMAIAWDEALTEAAGLYMDPSSAEHMKTTNPYRSQT